MKKILILALFLAPMLFISSRARAEDWSPFDLWKGDFIRDNITGEAGGEVSLNYIKGQKAYRVNMEVWGLTPDKEYQLWLMTETGYVETSPNHIELGKFTTDTYGMGHLNLKINEIQQIVTNLENDNIRVVVYADPRVMTSWVLSTSMGVENGDFEPIGSNRGE